MCLLLRLILFWHGLAILKLVMSTQHHYSAQIDFNMHEFLNLFLFSHALRYHHDIFCVWYQIKEEKMPLFNNEAYSLIKTCVKMKISHWQNGYPFYWDTRYNVLLFPYLFKVLACSETWVIRKTSWIVFSLILIMTCNLSKGTINILWIKL